MICFAWSGLPQYAARCIAALSARTQERVVVVATRPRVPIKGMEELVPGGVRWVGADEKVSVRDLCGEVPQLLIVSGWAIPCFNRFRDEVRSSGGRVVAMSDGNATAGWRTFVRALRFRLFLKSKYHGFFVPGSSGRRLFHWFGVPSSNVFTGMYAADDGLFYDGVPLAGRPKRIIFVGRFHPVKNVTRLCEAFEKSGGAAAGWRLDLYGSGNLRGQLMDYSERCPAIGIHDFLQPEQLAEEYRQSRIFVLPSVKEPWGLVVHEAALSGCLLLLSDCIGAGEDFLDEGVNGLSFKPRSVPDLTQKLCALMNWSELQMSLAHDVSLEKAKTCSKQKFSDSVIALANRDLG